MFHNGIKRSKEEQSSNSNSNPCKRILNSAISAQNLNFDCASEGDAAHHPGSTIFEATRGTGQVETGASRQRAFTYDTNRYDGNRTTPQIPQP
jgi:hypothetical protein